MFNNRFFFNWPVFPILFPTDHWTQDSLKCRKKTVDHYSVVWWLQIKSVFTLASFRSASQKMWPRYDDQRTDGIRPRFDPSAASAADCWSRAAAAACSALRVLSAWRKAAHCSRDFALKCFQKMPKMLDYLCFDKWPKWSSQFWRICKHYRPILNNVTYLKKNPKQTLFSPSAKTTWLVTNEWATVLLMDFGSTDILPVWNHTKSRKKRTKSTSIRHWFGPEQTTIGVKKRPKCLLQCAEIDGKSSKSWCYNNKLLPPRSSTSL